MRTRGGGHRSAPGKRGGPAREGGSTRMRGGRRLPCFGGCGGGGGFHRGGGGWGRGTSQRVYFVMQYPLIQCKE